MPLVESSLWEQSKNANRGPDSSCKPRNGCLAPTVASLLHSARNKEIGTPMWSLDLALSIGVSWYNIVPFLGNRLRP